MLALVLGVSGMAQALSGYATSFKTKYPSSPLSSLSTVSGQAGNLCTVCHGVSGGARNTYGSNFASSTIGNHTYNAALEAADSDVDGFSNLAEITAGTFPGNAASKPAAGDTTAPTVSTFTIPATATSLTVSIMSFMANDNVGVAGYKVTETSTAPLASATGWSATAPANYTFATAGAKTLYAWAKDAAGNVSLSKSASVTITITVADTTAPTVSAFTIPATATSLMVAITTLTATDNTAVTGYKLTETATAPLAGATGWSATKPANYTFATAGAKTLYAWARDAAGNVSLSKSASVTITITINGAMLYGNNCAGCHGNLATSSKKGRTAVQIQDAITGDAGGMGYLSTLTSAEVQAIADVLADPDRMAIFSNGMWYIDLNGNGVWDGPSVDRLYNFGGGMPGAGGVRGDWDGTGTKRIGVYADGTWYLDMNGNGSWDGATVDSMASFGKGLAGAMAVTGDWDGSGNDKLGVYADGVWYLDMNGNGSWDGTPVDNMLVFGRGVAGAVPATGAWDGSGGDKLGVYSNGVWYLDMNGNGSWDGASVDRTTTFGFSGAKPMGGKW